ncbi:MAG: PAS domain-containing protein [Gemmatimonadaceae bacterium]|nr:PAS domain-containing protein [Gemmatimonadaceae bacterium]
MSDGESSGVGSFSRYMEGIAAAFAVTRDAEHELVYANAAFRGLTGVTGELAIGSPITDAFTGPNTVELRALLDRAIRTGVVARDQRIDPGVDDAPAWSCTVWPNAGQNGEPGHLVIELREASFAENTLALQREVAERMLLSALREHDAAAGAEASSRRAVLLAEEGRRLADSLDEVATLKAMSGLSLPYLGSWCIVDVLERDSAMRRLAIIHPNPAKQSLARELEGSWQPEPGDPFGIPAALRSAEPTVIAADIGAALATAAHDPETLHALLEIGVGPLLTVPLVVGERRLGAITFVGSPRAAPYTPEDVELAKDLAIRSALALDRARMHGEAIELKTEADSANRAKSAFLGTMSHELRTPLNAIGGYVDLVDMGVHGPVTEAQHVAFARIRSNQQHLISLVSDILNFVSIGGGRVSYDIADVVASEILGEAVALVAPLIRQKELLFDGVSCDPTIVVSADVEKVKQIVLNLLSNAIKFTGPGGRLVIDCDAADGVVVARFADTGIGIPPEKLEVIFDPFIQVRAGLAGRDTGVGLGLSISRDLARGMGGDLTVESVLGSGSTFTLTLPRAN